MSVTDPSADPVQPEGQGGEGTPDAPYSEYLDRIPQEVRGEVEPVFKDWDANVTRRFQEHSEYRKQWEPYQELGLTEHQPDDVAWALQFRQAALENPQAVKEWFDQYAQQHGLAEAAQAAEQQSGEFDFQDPSQQVQQLLEQALNPLKQELQSISGWRQQQEEAAQVAAGQAVIDQQISELKSKHGEEFTPKAQEWVMSRAQSEYISDPQNAIPRAWEDFRTLVNELSKQVLQSKVDAPPPAEGGGVATTSAEKHLTLKQAEVEALQFLKNENRQ